jgi:hypothetical protein
MDDRLLIPPIVMVLDLQFTIARVFECSGYNSREELERLGRERNWRDWVGISKKLGLDMKNGNKG